jgi:hypothetical protein
MRRNLPERLLGRVREEWAGLRRTAALVGWRRVDGTPRTTGVAVRPGSDEAGSRYASDAATDQPRRLR